jgi:hypothetical protein
MIRVAFMQKWSSLIHNIMVPEKVVRIDLSGDISAGSIQAKIDIIVHILCAYRDIGHDFPAYCGEDDPIEDDPKKDRAVYAQTLLSNLCSSDDPPIIYISPGYPYLSGGKQTSFELLKQGLKDALFILIPEPVTQDTGSFKSPSSPYYDVEVDKYGLTLYEFTAIKQKLE